MRSVTVTRCVIAAVALSWAPFVPVASAQAVERVADQDAYAIYAELLPTAWAAVSKGEMVLQRETTTDSACAVGAASTDPEWMAASADFRLQNARPRLLQPIASIGVPYRFISKSELDADDVRLALKYPGTYQRRPESIEFVAVSAVGFNPARTRAIVYIRFRSSGGMRFLERREGKWVRSSLDACGWIT